MPASLPAFVHERASETFLVTYSMGYGTAGMGFPKKPHSSRHPAPASMFITSKSPGLPLKCSVTSALCLR